ncbi:hypothetical protein LTR05_005603 [Lithohypha guttulata]|uniref:Sodium/calcium exchanger membrane region domain-containing protein n=1 Tax=Lithohypha guttulata TaxID=1690604 RepID=A0AAN7YFL8_9EURO|nr:hypothetical protein LTR05_005603 [Lithohypha guttulata]
MYKVRAWAHDTAHKHNFNPWSADTTDSTSDPTSSPPNEPRDGEPEKNTTRKPVARQLFDCLKIIVLRSWLNVLLVFVPAGIAVRAAGIDPNVVFALNAVAVIPLAGLLTFATECLASRFSPTVAALLNVSFGNSVELIIFIIALVQNQIRIVQASLIGSILANLLLILGMSMTLGGLKFQEQIYDSVVTQMSSSLLALSSLSLLIPTAFHASFNDQARADYAVIQMSRGTSVILLLVYVLYLLFQLRSHAYLYAGTPQYLIDEQTQPGILQRMNSTSSESSLSAPTTRSTSVSTVSTGGGSIKKRRRVRRKIQAKLGRKRVSKTEEEVIQEEQETPPDNPVPLPSTPEPSAIERAQLRATDTSAAMADPAANVALNMATATAPTARRPFPTRSISIRAPPVFRADSSVPQTINRHYTPPSQLNRFHSAPNLATRDSPARADTEPPEEAKSMASSKPKKDDPPLGIWSAIFLLLGSTALVAICAEFLVGSIEHLVENSPLSEAFVGLIILPIVGNAAEHVTAVVVASKNKLDLALGISLGSSIQIALFVTPLVVIIGWGIDKEMSLYFTLFETVCLFVSVFVVCFLCLDGKSNYLEGALLCAAYIIIAVGAYFFPDSEGQNALTGGTSGSS